MQIPTVKLRTVDHEIVEIDLDIAQMFGALRPALADLEDDQVIPLHSVRSPTLLKVIEWACQHRDDPPIYMNSEPVPQPVARFQQIIDYDVNFLKGCRDAHILDDIVDVVSNLQIWRLLEIWLMHRDILADSESPDVEEV